MMPLSSLELRLVGMLASEDMTSSILHRLRDVMLEMYTTRQISRSAINALLSHIEGRCSRDEELLALHEETCALVRVADAARTTKDH